LTEWVATGRVDLALIHNSEPNPAIEVIPVLDEALGLVGPAQGRLAKLKPLSLAELADYPLILPERTHSMRKLLETQAALVGLKLNVVLEVSSVQSILELVAAGHGYGVLAQTALAASGRPEAFSLRPLVKPVLTSTLFLAVSAHKPATPLGRQVLRMLQELVQASANSTAPVIVKTR
jgi:LysR family nitrogen assimilation transcriptional regulator